FFRLPGGPRPETPEPRPETTTRPQPGPQERPAAPALAAAPAERKPGSSTSIVPADDAVDQVFEEF
ncbi:MAG TPA: hypothetical protein VFL04_01405, partial [Rectinemataceae bacterium]|nr:hypothetical protein [Rectinemataceae bacterium]